MLILKPGIWIALIVLLALNIITWILLIRVTRAINDRKDLDTKGKKEMIDDKCPTLTRPYEPDE